MSTPGSDIGREKHVLRRARVKVGELVADKAIGIHYYYEPSSPALSTVKLASMISLLQCHTIEPIPYYTHVIVAIGKVAHL